MKNGIGRDELAAAADALDALPAREPRLSVAQALEQLRAQLLALRARGYSLDQVAAEVTRVLARAVSRKAVARALASASGVRAQPRARRTGTQRGKVENHSTPPPPQ